MPGLIGFIHNISSSDAATMLGKMASAINKDDRYRVDLFHDDGIGIGRVGLNLSNPYPQPFWNVDETICAILEGEIFGYEELVKELGRKGYSFKSDFIVELLLHVYEEYGEEFALHLNGAFVAAIWDRKQRKIVLANDHLGLRPLYYSYYKEKFSFSSSINAMLVDPELPRDINLISIAQMLCFEYVLGEDTLLEHVHLLPPASILTFQNNKITLQKYWSLQYSAHHLNGSIEETLDEFIFLLRQAVTRQAPGNLPAGVNLSGGLDSRLLLGLLCETPSKVPLRTFTFGIPKCSDARYAEEIARSAGTLHKFFQLTPGSFKKIVDNGVYITDGLESCVHMHALANVESQSNSVNILYSGFYIDSLTNPKLKREWWANYNFDTASQILFNELNFKELFKHPDIDEVFSSDMKRKVSARFDESFRYQLMKTNAAQFADWNDNIELLQRQRRFTNQGNEIMRCQVITRTPFCDKDLVQFALQIPPGLRFERYLIRQILAKYFHSLAKIPWDRTDFPIVPCVRELRLRVQQQIEWQAQRIGMDLPLNKSMHNFTDYDNWMRNELRSWVEATLLNKQSLERGYFNSDVVRNLVTEHMAGANHSRKLGILLSIELWHQQSID